MFPLAPLRRMARSLQTTLLDMGGPALLLAFAGGAACLWFGIPIIEAIVLLLIKWGSLRRSLIHAFAINLVSTLIGFVGLYAFQPNVYSMAYLALTFVLTVLIEGGVLTLLSRESPPRKTWLAALIVNFVTYIPLALLVLADSQSG